MYHGFIKVDQGRHMPYIYLFWYETKIHDIDDLQKRLTQTCFDFDWNIINAGVTIWDHVCMLVVDTLNACSDIYVHLYESPEHLIKLSM